MDTITDNVMKTLNNKTNRTTLRNYGLKDLNINSANMSYEDANGHMMFMREIDLRFQQITKVVA